MEENPELNGGKLISICFGYIVYDSRADKSVRCLNPAPGNHALASQFSPEN